MQLIGSCLEKKVLPLVEAGQQPEDQNMEDSRLVRHCREYANRVFELLDESRDLCESRILVLDNGTGYLPRRLAEGETDIVAVELTDKLKKSALFLNSYPSIVYKKTNPLLLTEEFDLIIDSGILCHLHPEILTVYLPRLARFSRRKMILEFRHTRPWHMRLLSRNLDSEIECQDLEIFRFSQNDILNLIENSCDMLLTERNVRGTSVLIKALRKAHSSRRLRSDSG